MKIDTVFNVVQGRLGLKVQRCHGIPHQGSYSVGEHVSGMMLLAWHLYPEDFAALAPVILGHDIGEGWLGDIPSPTMRYVPGLRDAMEKLEGAVVASIGLPTEHGLSPELYAKLRAIDRLELLMWAMEQVMVGNAYAQGCIDELAIYLGANPSETLPGAAFLFYQRLLKSSVLPVQAGVVKSLVERLG